eukprot:scaffold69341_cov20-Tisochrysis_lutea.AAC.1
MAKANKSKVTWTCVSRSGLQMQHEELMLSYEAKSLKDFPVDILGLFEGRPQVKVACLCHCAMVTIAILAQAKL